MQKLYSECIGMPVFDTSSERSLALVRDLIVDPENGKLLAFVVKKNQIIVPYDIERMNRGLYIADKDRILGIPDVLRVFTVVQKNIRLIGARVLTERTKMYLGLVVDYEIDTKTMSLTKLYTAKLFLFFRFRESIIPFQHIVSIEKERILVKDTNLASLKQKIAAPLPLRAT